jgi:hypothetical protein
LAATATVLCSWSSVFYFRYALQRRFLACEGAS